LPDLAFISKGEKSGRKYIGYAKTYTKA